MTVARWYKTDVSMIYKVKGSPLRRKAGAHAIRPDRSGTPFFFSFFFFPRQHGQFLVFQSQRNLLHFTLRDHFSGAVTTPSEHEASTPPSRWNSQPHNLVLLGGLLETQRSEVRNGGRVNREARPGRMVNNALNPSCALFLVKIILVLQ